MKKENRNTEKDKMSHEMEISCGFRKISSFFADTKQRPVSRGRYFEVFCFKIFSVHQRFWKMVWTLSKNYSSSLKLICKRKKKHKILVANDKLVSTKRLLILSKEQDSRFKSEDLTDPWSSKIATENSGPSAYIERKSRA